MNQDPRILPYFPLSVFLLPGEDIPLRIFEPRYKQLIEDAKNEGISFAIPFVIDSDIQEIGCEVKLKEIVAENPAGRMVINVESIGIVRIHSFSKQLSGKLYAGGEISNLDPPGLIVDRKLMHLVMNYVDHFDHDFLNCCDESDISYYNLLSALNLSSEEKFNFVSYKSDEQKINFLTTQMHFLMMIRNQEQMLGNDFGLN